MTNIVLLSKKLEHTEVISAAAKSESQNCITNVYKKKTHLKIVYNNNNINFIFLENSTEIEEK